MGQTLWMYTLTILLPLCGSSLARPAVAADTFAAGSRSLLLTPLIPPSSPAGSPPASPVVVSPPASPAPASPKAPSPVVVASPSPAAKAPPATAAPEATASPEVEASPEVVAAAPTPAKKSPSKTVYTSPSPGSTAAPGPAQTALIAVIIITGPDVWPFTNAKVVALTNALATTMTATIAKSDINTLSVTQPSTTVSTASLYNKPCASLQTGSGRRRLLQTVNSSANVTVEFNAHSTNNINTVAANLDSVTNDGSLLAALKKNGVTANSLYIDNYAASTLAAGNTCDDGAVNGICIGASSAPLSTGGIIAIAVVGGVIACVLVFLVLYCCFTRIRNMMPSRAAATDAPKPRPMTPTKAPAVITGEPVPEGAAAPASYIPPRPKAAKTAIPVTAAPAGGIPAGRAGMPTAAAPGVGAPLAAQTALPTSRTGGPAEK